MDTTYPVPGQVCQREEIVCCRVLQLGCRDWLRHPGWFPAPTSCILCATQEDSYPNEDCPTIDQVLGVEQSPAPPSSSSLSLCCLVWWNSMRVFFSMSETLVWNQCSVNCIIFMGKYYSMQEQHNRQYWCVLFFFGSGRQMLQRHIAAVYILLLMFILTVTFIFIHSPILCWYSISVFILVQVSRLSEVHKVRTVSPRCLQVFNCLPSL